MKKILLILSLFPILVFSQKSYKIPADSTILNNIGSGKNELVIRNATSNITGGVLTNLGNGVTAFVLGGGSARVVDTIYKNSAKDSIVFTISGIRYAVKDSFNLNTDSQTLSLTRDTLSISNGNSLNLPSLLFPNGAKLVETDRAVQADDAGYVLVLSDGVQLTIPTICPLSPGQYFGISTNSATASFILEGAPSGAAVYLSYAGQEAALVNEVVTYGAADMGGSTSLILLTQIAGSNDTIMTANRYFFDQSQNAIPLSGTEVGSPVNGDIYFNDATSLVLNDGGGGASFRVGYSGVNTFLTFQTGSGLDYIGVNSDGVGASRGLAGGADYSANITDLDYTQKIYVDNAISSNRKVDTSYIFRNSTLDSLCQITVINGISYRSCGKDSVGAGSSTLALDKITDAVDSSTLNAGNYKQEWKWNSLANNTGFKLSSTSGGLLNTQNRLFEVEMSGAMPGTGNSSYAGYFVNNQTNGGGAALYAEGGGGGGTAILANGSINIQTGRLQLGGGSGALFYRLSGNTYLQASNTQGLVLQSSSGVASIYCGSNELGIIASRKTLNQRYVLGIGGTIYQSSAYLSQNTTATLIEKDLGKLIFSANTGLAGGFASFTPNNVMTINGGATEATSNVGIGTTTPDATAKLEVSSTTSGFLPPRMTATQASAISTPAQGLLLFVSDTNGTFTSVGWWGYNGSTWEKLNN